MKFYNFREKEATFNNGLSSQYYISFDALLNELPMHPSKT